MSTNAPVKVSADLLRTLHRVHRQQNDLQTRLDRGPRQIRAGEAAIVASQAALDTAKQTLKRAKMAADEKQLQLKTRELRVLDLQGKLNSASSNREFSTIKEQIAADEAANAVLSDEIFEALEQLDVLQAQVEQRQQELELRQSEHEKLVLQVTERTAALEQELQRVTGQREAAEGRLPPEVRTDYERIVAGRGEEGLAPVDGETCGGCYQMLSPQVMNRLYLSQLVACASCGAWLYLPEDRTVK